MGNSKIQWTHSTWPVVTGCSHAGSPGCDMCYAARMAATRLKHHPRYAGLATIKDGRARWTGEVRLNHDVLEQPLRWRKPRRIFIASMSDLFHEDIPGEFVLHVFDMIAITPQHTYQILTKRPLSMLDWFNRFDPKENRWYKPLSNLWLGVSVENQEQFDSRWYWASQIPAAVLFVSCEPLLASVKFNVREWERLPDWVICGGESGPGARPMHPNWVRSLRDQCQAAGVPFFFKQHGAWLYESQFTTDEQRDKGLSSKRCEADDGYQFVRIGKGAAGHLLDGRTWQEFPT